METPKVQIVHCDPKVIYNEFPPNIDQIKAVFPLACESTVFAYGDKIYVPSGVEIPPEILAHERIHCERQLAIGLDQWWDQYFFDKQFRLVEEVIAHQVEYQFLRGLYPGAHRKHAILEHVAKKLSHEIYGNLCSLKRAKELVKQ